MPARRAYLLILTGLALSGCSGTYFDQGRTETVLPLNRAWVNGHRVEYVTTDISDPVMAKALGVNYAPRLANALAVHGQHSVLERVYKFAHDEQISVFQSAPAPTGPNNKDSHYSPLWRMVMVYWKRPERRQELKSEEEILAAEDRGDLEVQVTQILINCPITRSVDGQALKGIR